MVSCQLITVCHSKKEEGHCGLQDNVSLAHQFQIRILSPTVCTKMYPLSFLQTPSSQYTQISPFNLYYLFLSICFFGFSLLISSISFLPYCKRMAQLHLPSAKYLNILLFCFSPFRLSYSLSTSSSLCIPCTQSEICFLDTMELVVGGGKCLKRTKQIRQS